MVLSTRFTSITKRIILIGVIISTNNTVSTFGPLLSDAVTDDDDDGDDDPGGYACKIHEMRVNIHNVPVSAIFSHGSA